MDGGSVIRHVVATGFVDDLTISIVPILLGDGSPLFASRGREARLELVASRSFASGLVQVEYRVGARFLRGAP